jgi:formylglycine-generating enzyme required for sulfatase activity
MSTETERLVIELAPSVRMAFRLIPPGALVMGSRGEYAEEEPRHRVEITKPFWLGETSVTQEQFAVWTSAAGVKHENHFPNKLGHPAENMDWFEASRFCLWLTGSGLLPADFAACLPTEAEWEYACRAGTDTEYHTGDGAEALAEAGWFDEDWETGSTHPVALKQPNAFGLLDMHGNVWDWCHDVFDERAYCSRVDGVCDPGSMIRDADYRKGRGFESGKNDPRRVLRGGSWSGTARLCRSAIRNWTTPVNRLWNCGFRVCLVPGPFKTEKETASQAEPATGAGGRGTRPEAQGAGGAEVDLAKEKLPPA